MKIENITLHHIRMPLVSAFETSFGRQSERECILIILQSDGVQGLGECVADQSPGYSYETTGTAWHILKDFIAPLILGQHFQDAAAFQGCVEGIRGHQLAKAGVEMAIWDLLGKQSGQSLRQLLGGIHEKVRVGVSVGIQDSTALLAQVVEGYLVDGYQRVKLKIKPGRDVRDTTAIRRAFPDLLLQVDANSAYSLESAQALLPLDDLDLLLIEQPLFEDDIWDHHKLQAMFRTPICLDESVVSLRHARYALEMEACRIINIKAGRVGGLSQALAIHNLCRDHGIPVWCGGMLETGIGRASNLALASLPGFVLPGDISASDRYYARDITNERFVLNLDSTIDVPTGTGLGATINQSALDKFTISRITLRA
jgi:O-succinylbenzoate synthase